MRLRAGSRTVELDRCLVMGIVNRTPDSFYDGGRMGLDDAIDHAMTLVEEGADILDLGAVKAGPGEEVAEQEEADRLLPLVEALSRETDILLSIETGRAPIARQAIEAGAHIVNDVGALADVELAAVCAETGAALVLMHHGGQIRGRPRHPRYEDVVAAVIGEWERLAAVAGSQGVEPEQLIADPGLDFGKTTYHSLELMRRLPELVAQPWPVLNAPSRKDVVGETLALPLGERLEGTLALVALSVAAGVAIIRVHDVRASVRVVRMVEGVMGSRPPEAPVRGLWD